jgi:hypothetical protein
LETKKKRNKLERNFFIIKATEIQDSWRKNKSSTVKKKVAKEPEVPPETQV